MILLGIDANCNLSEGAGAAGIEVDFGWKSPSSFGATYFFFFKDNGDDYSLASGLTCWLVTQLARRW